MNTQPLLIAIGISILTFFGIMRGADILIAAVDAIGNKNPSLKKLTGYLLGILTSLPEFVTSLAVIATNNPKIALANIVSSNIINLAFLVIQAKRSGNLRSLKNLIFKDEFVIISMTILSPIVVFRLYNSHMINALVGISFLALFFVWEKYLNKKPNSKGEGVSADKPIDTKSNSSILVSIVGGLVLLCVSGVFFGSQTDAIVKMTSESLPVISIIIGFCAGVATSIPELKSYGYIYTKNKDDILVAHQQALDNNTSSNIFNYGLVYGFCTIIGSFL